MLKKLIDVTRVVKWLFKLNQNVKNGLFMEPEFRLA